MLILVTHGNDWLDPAISLVIGAVIAVRAAQLLVATSSVLLESTPADLDIAALSKAITGVEGVEAVHDLHTWSLSSDAAWPPPLAGPLVGDETPVCRPPTPKSSVVP